MKINVIKKTKCRRRYKSAVSRKTHSPLAAITIHISYWGSCVSALTVYVCVPKGKGNAERTELLSWIFTRWRSVSEGEKTCLIKNRCFLIVCRAKRWKIKNCKDDYTQRQHYLNHLIWKNEHGHIWDRIVTKSWRQLWTKWKSIRIIHNWSWYYSLKIYDY